MIYVLLYLLLSVISYFVLHSGNFECNGSYVFYEILKTENKCDKGLFLFELEKFGNIKKKFCRPTNPNLFWHVTLNRGTIFLALYIRSETVLASPSGL